MIDQMLPLDDLETALVCFRIPFDGDLRTHVRESGELSEFAKNTFETIWSEAIDLRHWKSDLAASARNVKTVLERRFPEISSAALDVVVGAAAWDWR